MKRKILTGLLAVVFSVPVLAEWKEPADGKLTEKQVTDYIGATKEILDLTKATGKAMEGAGTAGATAMLLKLDDKHKAIVKKHNFEQEEFNWVTGKVTEAWLAAQYVQEWDKNSKPQLEKSIAENKAKQEELTKRIEALTASEKTGNRVLTKERREQMIKDATSNRESIAEELKSKDEEIKQATDEAAAKDKEAAEADAKAKKPPADLTGDEKEAFIEEQKTLATAAREAAKDIRANLADRKKEKDEIKTRLAQAEKRVSNPEAPLTDEEKLQFKTENEEALKSAKEELEQTKAAAGILKETLELGRASLTETLSKSNPANVELMSKHLDAWKAAIGIK